MRVLSLNSGSSSLKYAVFDATASGENVLLRGGVDCLARSDDEHAQAARGAFERLDAQGLTPDAVGHRIVHPAAPTGPRPRASTPSSLPRSMSSSPSPRSTFLPKFGPFNRFASAGPTCRRLPVSIPPFIARSRKRRVGMPYRRSWSAAGLRKYGFHGLSYEYVVSVIGVPALGRAVIAHLGSGSSMAAVSEGRSIDTTMGFTPAGGLVMGARPGDVDPGLLVFMRRRVDASTLDDIVNRQSGLRGLAESTLSPRPPRASSSDSSCPSALEVFVASARNGSCDGGCARRHRLARVHWRSRRACRCHSRGDRARVGHLGVAIDTARNERGDAVESAPTAPGASSEWCRRTRSVWWRVTRAEFSKSMSPVNSARPWP